MKFFRQNEVWIFLVVIVIANAIFVGSIAHEFLPRSYYNMGRFALLAAVLGGVVLLGSGWRGIVALLKPMTVWRVSPWWYLLALGWAASVASLVLVAKGAIFPGEPAALTPTLHVIARPTVAATVLIGSFIGEIVWVSYAVRQLSVRYTPFVGSQIVGVFWTLWWLPMVIFNVGVIPDLPPLALLVNMLGIAAMCAFVYMHTRSGLVVLILQFMVNSTALIFPVAPTTGGIPTYWCYALAYYVCVLLLYYGFGPWPLLRQARRGLTSAH